MMSFLKKLFKREKDGGELKDQDLIEAGACPNCWGNQKYAEQFIDFAEDQTKANINHDREHQKAFVQQFIETNVTGIRLKREGDQVVCSKCSKKYKVVSSEAN